VPPIAVVESKLFGLKRKKPINNDKELTMLDHIGLVVSDFGRSKSFFERALAPLGYTKLMEFGGAAGFGMAGKPDFWISQGEAPKPVHVAFAASDRKIVVQGKMVEPCGSSDPNPRARVSLRWLVSSADEFMYRRDEISSVATLLRVS
jgi:hypothetical protein